MNSAFGRGGVFWCTSIEMVDQSIVSDTASPLLYNYITYMGAVVVTYLRATLFNSKWL